jgi:hypothetical protein
MKIPKKLKMFGDEWKIIIDNNDGAGFNIDVRKIWIGKEEGEKGLSLLHEILETILLKLFYRFYGQEKGMEYQFHFDHTGLTRIVKDLYQVLKDNKLLK